MKRRTTFWVWAGLIAQLASAQMHTATIRGVILDPSGLAVVKSRVVLTSLNQKQTWECRTEFTGEYIFAQIPAGAYEITIQATGFATQRRNGITLHAGQVAVFDLKMDVNAVA
jgi:hypothetical protein